MTKNDHIEAFTRLYALHLADGDIDKAEKYISWAYGNPESAQEKEKKPRNRTTSFVRRFLSPCVPFDKEKVERFINQNVIKEPRGVNFQDVEMKIKNMPYADFLNTTYWRGVSLFVKRRDGWKCSVCGSTDKIDVHHKTYESHGDELNHMEDLVCLCRKCHEKEHVKTE